MGYEEQLINLKGPPTGSAPTGRCRDKHSFYLEQRERILQKIKELGWSRRSWTRKLAVCKGNGPAVKGGRKTYSLGFT